MLYPTELQARVVYAGRWPLLPYGRLSLLYEDCRWGQAIGCIKTSEIMNKGYNGGFVRMQAGDTGISDRLMTEEEQACMLTASRGGQQNLLDAAPRMP